MYTLAKQEISSSLVKEYIYCPLIPWIISKYGVVEPPTESMVQGLEEKEKKGLGQVRARSRRYRVSCIVDEVRREKNGIVVVEYKKFKTRRYLRYKFQLLAQVLAVQETIGPVRKAVLSMAGKIIEYTVTQEDLEQVKRVIEELRKVMEDDKPPAINPDPRKCSSCWYKRFCPAR